MGGDAIVAIDGVPVTQPRTSSGSSRSGCCRARPRRFTVVSGKAAAQRLGHARPPPDDRLADGLGFGSGSREALSEGRCPCRSFDRISEVYLADLWEADAMSAEADGTGGKRTGANGAQAQSIRLTIPAKPEYITLGRLALTGIARLRAEPLARRGARRPEARAHRGLHELGPPRLREAARARSRSPTSSTPTGWSSRSSTRARASSRRPARARSSTTTSSPRAASGSRSSTRSPTSSRSRERAARRLLAPLRQAPGLARFVLPLVNVGHKSLGDYADARLARADGGDQAAGRAARRASASCTSPRPRSAAASPRSTTRSCR